MTTSFAVSADGTRIAFDPAKWTPVVDAAHAGTLDLDRLSVQDRAIWQAGSIPFTVALLGAIVGWPPVEPQELRCPTLWLVGTANENAMTSVNEFRDRCQARTWSSTWCPGSRTRTN